MIHGNRFMVDGAKVGIDIGLPKDTKREWQKVRKAK